MIGYMHIMRTIQDVYRRQYGPRAERVKTLHNLIPNEGPMPLLKFRDF